VGRHAQKIPTKGSTHDQTSTEPMGQEMSIASPFILIIPLTRKMLAMVTLKCAVSKIALRPEENGMTYKLPRRKTPTTANFLRKGICSFAIVGKGTQRTEKSIRRLEIATATSNLWILKQ